MSTSPEALHAIRAVARPLGELREQVVFAGDACPRAEALGFDGSVPPDILDSRISSEKAASDVRSEEQTELVTELETLTRRELETGEGREAWAPIRARIEAIRQVVA